MLELAIVVLLILWLLGVIGNVAGGLIHVLLIAVLVLFFIRLAQGRRVL